MTDLSFDELNETNGGASFAYRAGQFFAILADASDGVFLTPRWCDGSNGLGIDLIISQVY
jgi:hypothetical protein